MGLGVSEGQEADDWFTKALGRPVIFLRASPMNTKKVNQNYLQQSKKDDFIKNFISESAVHVINEASVRDLRQRVANRYQNSEELSQIKVDVV